MPKWPRNKGVHIHPEDAARVRELAGQGYYPSVIARMLPQLTMNQIKYQVYGKCPQWGRRGEEMYEWKTEFGEQSIKPPQK